MVHIKHDNIMNPGAMNMPLIQRVIEAHLKNNNETMVRKSLYIVVRDKPEAGNLQWDEEWLAEIFLKYFSKIDQGRFNNQYKFNDVFDFRVVFISKFSGQTPPDWYELRDQVVRESQGIKADPNRPVVGDL